MADKAQIARGIAGALQGGWSGAQQGMNMENMLMDNKRAQQQLLMQQEQMALQKQQVQQQMQLQAVKAGDDMLDQYFKMAQVEQFADTADAWAPQRAQLIDTMYQAAGMNTKYSQVLTKENMKSVSPLLKWRGATKQRISAAASAGVRLTFTPEDETAMRAYEAFFGTGSLDPLRKEIQVTNEAAAQQADIARLGVRGPGGTIRTKEGLSGAATVGLEAKDAPDGGFQLRPEEKAVSDYQRMLQESRIDAAAQRAAQSLDNDKIFMKLKEQDLNSNFLTELADAARTGNQVAANSMGVKAAKAMGEVGVMTDKDVVRYVRGGSITRALGDKLSKWIKGTPTEMTLDEINQVQSIFQTQYNERVQPIVNKHIERFATNYLDAKRPSGKDPMEQQAWDTALRVTGDRLGYTYKPLNTKAPDALTPEQQSKADAIKKKLGLE